MAYCLPVLVECPCLEGVFAWAERMIAGNGLARIDALLVDVAHLVVEVAARVVAEVERREVDGEVVEIVGQG